MQSERGSLNWGGCLLLIWIVLLTGCDELKEVYGVGPSNDDMVYVPIREMPIEDIVDDNLTANEEYCESKNMSLGETSEGGFVCTTDNGEVDELKEITDDDDKITDITAYPKSEDDRDIWFLLTPPITIGFCIFLCIIFSGGSGGGGNREKIDNQIKGEYFY